MDFYLVYLTASTNFWKTFILEKIYFSVPDKRLRFKSEIFVQILLFPWICKEIYFAMKISILYILKPWKAQ